MSPALPLLAVLAASGGLKLAAPSFRCPDFDQQKCELYFEQVVSRLNPKVALVRQRDMGPIIGASRTKKLVACHEQDAACMSELAESLGCSGVLLVTIAKISDGYAASVKVMSVKDGTAIVSLDDRLENETALLDWLAQSSNAAAERAQRELSGDPAWADAAAAATVARDTGPKSPGWARIAAYIGFGGSAAILATSIVSGVTTEVGDVSLALGITATALTLVVVPVVAIGGSSARGGGVTGLKGLRVVGWIAYAIALTSAAGLIGVGASGGSAAPAWIITTGAIGTVASLSMSIDALISAVNAEGP